MWIKICGNTNLEDARLAVEAGTDALGFVFAPSPRRVSTDQARRITAEVPPEIEKYGVFVDVPLAEIVATVEVCGLTGVQLHRSHNQSEDHPPDHSEDQSRNHPGERDLSLRLREHFAKTGRKVSIVRVLSLPVRTDWSPTSAPASRAQMWGARGSYDTDLTFEEALAETSGDAAVDAVLVDSSTAAAAGGTGVSFDWGAVRASFRRMAGSVHIILAGGLRPENVKQAISTLRPWGVDVVSGVEAIPGKKDPARLIAFIQAAREAEAALPDAE